jgi:hypothetical protein
LVLFVLAVDFFVFYATNPTAANGFGRGSLTMVEEWTLHHARYLVPSDMRLPHSGNCGGQRDRCPAVAGHAEVEGRDQGPPPTPHR